MRPRGDRNFETKTINLAFVVEEGARAYIERINIRGNTRTRDYVIGASSISAKVTRITARWSTAPSVV